jgi:hypothetical protein
MTVASLAVALQDALSFAQAADFVPGRPHVATVWRWATHGVRGIRLQSWSIGGRRFTTTAALEEFLRALNSPERSAPAPIPQEAPRVS